MPPVIEIVSRGEMILEPRRRVNLRRRRPPLDICEFHRTLGTSAFQWREQGTATISSLRRSSAANGRTAPPGGRSVLPGRSFSGSAAADSPPPFSPFSTPTSLHHHRFSAPGRDVPRKNRHRLRAMPHAPAAPAGQHRCTHERPDRRSAAHPEATQRPPRASSGTAIASPWRRPPAGDRTHAGRRHDTEREAAQAAFFSPHDMPTPRVEERHT